MMLFRARAMSIFLNFLLGLCIMVRLGMEIEMVTVFRHGLIRLFILDSGEVTSRMVKVNLLILLEIIMRESG